MRKINRVDDRLAIAKALDEKESAWRNVNNIPEVQKAREESDKARRASDDLARKFSRIFDSYAPRNVDARLAEQFPGVLVLGRGEEAYTRWIPRCAVTQLPIFIGDRVYIGGGEEDYKKTFILADAVTLAPGYEAQIVVVNEDGEAA